MMPSTIHKGINPLVKTSKNVLDKYIRQFSTRGYVPLSEGGKIEIIFYFERKKSVGVLGGGEK